ncbi:unnamed protein product [Pieris macdunnoughi]|uniref:Uncharacterized protein n=1 Tax=Pieris macdunnoughi TaxID=345717 RepID=A0A821V935_9NEOP|nr:unnamed protein product [Pieris macdunnoughi]
MDWGIVTKTDHNRLLSNLVPDILPIIFYLRSFQTAFNINIGFTCKPQVTFNNIGSKYDELRRALLTVKCLLPALASLRNACRLGSHSLGKHYPQKYARYESFHNGNRPRQQSLITGVHGT